MKKFLAALGLAGALALAGLAVATPGGATSSTSLGACLPGWYVNGDETGRKPTPTANGLKFEANQLIHHGATGTIEGLAGGTFAASPSPDQPSFFSVEVRNADGSGYATLRWNHITSKWNMVASGQFFEHASASELVKMTTPAKSSALLSFGVGYTNSPPGTVATVIKSVTFRGTTYNLKCTPVSSSTSVAPTATPTTQPPTLPPTAVPTSASGTGAPVITGSLPLTGARTGVLVAGGGGVLALGVVLVALARRRRTRFEAS